jgi:hypothetical protein
MTLFSDVDWIVILGVAAFLMFGSQGQQFVRQLGRYYARLLRFRAELMREVTSSAGVSLPAGGSVGSLRSALLGSDVPSPPAPGPASINGSPGIMTQIQPVNIRAVETVAYGAGMGPGTWSVASTSNPGEVVQLR